MLTCVEHPFKGGVLEASNSLSLLLGIREARIFCLKLLTTPYPPLRNGIFLLRRSHPCLKTEGNGLGVIHSNARRAGPRFAAVACLLAACIDEFNNTPLLLVQYRRLRARYHSGSP